ncbi:MAG: hypothetical protein NW226_25840 [Microscillaceae bacterium]|nr:hypothetical protein [Microscillaceae bacterium]
MDFLIIYEKNRKVIGEVEFLKAVSNIKGITNIHQEKDERSVVSVDFQYENSFTVIRLSEDLDSFSIWKKSDASLYFAWAINQYLSPNFNLYVTDSDYNFDLNINKIMSLEDFRKIILEDHL